MKLQTERLEIRLSPETKAAWQARADSEGRTISAMVRNAVDKTAGDDSLVDFEIDCTEDDLRAWGAEAAVKQRSSQQAGSGAGHDPHLTIRTCPGVHLSVRTRTRSTNTTPDHNDELFDENDVELPRDLRAGLMRGVAAVSPEAKAAVEGRLASYGRAGSGVALSETDALELMLEHGCKVCSGTRCG